ncbi:MAG: hypothetical protein M1330_04465 [Armatimonadetes bacterium]|nr:hypothetical protein [Armatimonadota bacterium]
MQLFGLALVLSVALWLAGVAGPALLMRMGLYHPNFKGAVVPNSYGILIAIWLLLAILGTAAVVKGVSFGAAPIVLLIGFAVLGAPMTSGGDRRIGGIRGHSTAFWQRGHFTTGLVKMIGGGALAIGVVYWSWPSESVISIIRDAAVIAMMANAFNLLDVRPGRATACGLALGGVGLLVTLFIVKSGSAGTVYLLVLLEAAYFAEYLMDSRAEVMLGDSGSNLLGAMLGWGLIGLAPPTFRWIAFWLLISFHLFTEKWSLSEVIDRQPILRWLDRRIGVR